MNKCVCWFFRVCLVLLELNTQHGFVLYLGGHVLIAKSLFIESCSYFSFCGSALQCGPMSLICLYIVQKCCNFKTATKKGRSEFLRDINSIFWF